MLKFDNSWLYNSPGKIPDEVFREFLNLIGKIARGEQGIIEHFKSSFASAAGTTSSWSSSASWADSDLQNYMSEASENTPLFISAFYDACITLEDRPVPDVSIINNILAKNKVNFEIQPPNLIAINSDLLPVAQAEIPKSLDDSAKEIIERAFTDAQKLLSEGRYRPAVQEVLWLLETVSTAFQGVNNSDDTSIEGKYFNKIVEELRNKNKGTPLEQIIGWITRLHGYLSAPAGGAFVMECTLKTA